MFSCTAVALVSFFVLIPSAELAFNDNLHEDDKSRTPRLPLTGLLSLELSSPNQGWCYTQGASLISRAEILLLGVDDKTALQALSTSSHGIKLCLSIDQEYSVQCWPIDSPLPTVTLPVEAGCHTARLSIRSWNQQQNDNIKDEYQVLIESNLITFQLASLLRCEVNLCAGSSMPHVFPPLQKHATAPETGLTRFYPRPPLIDGNIAAAEFMKLVSLSFDKKNITSEVQLVSPSPSNGDVVWSHGVLIEVALSRTVGGEQAAVSTLLWESWQQKRKGPLGQEKYSFIGAQLCVHVLLVGQANVTATDVVTSSVTAPWANKAYNICLEPILDSSVIEDHMENIQWEASVVLASSTETGAPLFQRTGTMPAGPPHLLRINASLVSDGQSNVVKVTFPPELWGNEESTSNNGIIVGVQAWLLPKVYSGSNDDNDDLLGKSVWSIGLPTSPRLVALAPMNNRKHFHGVSATKTPHKNINAVVPRETSLEFPSLGSVGRVLSAAEISEDPSILIEQTRPVLVLCHWAENLEWLNTQPFDVVLYEKKPQFNATKHGVPRNVAGEASAFLKFIVDYYHMLPPRMVFFHSHRWAYHQEDISILLSNLPVASTINLEGSKEWDEGGDEGDAYCNINRVMWGHKEDPGQAWLRYSWDGEVNLEGRNELLPSGHGDGGWMSPWLGPLPQQQHNETQDTHKEEEYLPLLVERCCAQFLVKAAYLSIT